jgi:adenylylsulfate reductase subunit A
MGLAREDLVYDVGRHVDASVHLLEEWGLPIWKKDNGEYERIGRWQIRFTASRSSRLPPNRLAKP